MKFQTFVKTKILFNMFIVAKISILYLSKEILNATKFWVPLHEGPISIAEVVCLGPPLFDVIFKTTLQHTLFDIISYSQSVHCGWWDQRIIFRRFFGGRIAHILSTCCSPKLKNIPKIGSHRLKIDELLWTFTLKLGWKSELVESLEMEISLTGEIDIEDVPTNLRLLLQQIYFFFCKFEMEKLWWKEISILPLKIIVRGFVACEQHYKWTSWNRGY